jgi:dihydrofolate reductase
MPRVTVFNHVTVDGFFAGPRGEIDWFKAIRKDAEYEAYTHRSAESGNTLVFGRATYEMMKSFWPTPQAIALDPGMARVVNESPKIVYSKKLKSVEEGPHWKNIRLFDDIRRAEILEQKERAQTDFTILGSGSIVQQFAKLGLIDEYCLVVVPVVLGAGKPLFKNLATTSLELLESRAFKNGLAVLRYRPA